MEMSRQTLTLMLVAVAVLTCAVPSTDCGEPKQHVVGGSRSNGWAPNVNYTLWAARERFYVGDWLTFFYQKGYYDVMEVNGTDYERCSPDHPLRNESKGNSYSYQLNRTGPCYFICSRGQCWSGMKLAINVEPVPPPAPAPAPAPAPTATTSSGAAATLDGASLWAAAMAAACASVVMFGMVII